VHTNHLVHEDMLEQPRVVMEPSRQHHNEANALLQMGDNPDPMDILGKSAHLAATLAWADMQINADEVLWSVYTAPDAPVRFQRRDARHIQSIPRRLAMHFTASAFPPFRLTRPATPAIPLVADSPHSGTTYPADFDVSIPMSILRSAEDTYVDELWAGIADVG